MTYLHKQHATTATTRTASDPEQSEVAATHDRHNHDATNGATG